MPGLREALETGFDEIVGGEATPEPVEPAAPEAPAAEPAEQPQEATQPAAGEAQERARTDDGRFAKEPPSKAPTKPAAPSSGGRPAAGAAAAGAVPAPAPAAAPIPAGKPPQSWTVAEREHWLKLPPEAQKAIIRREQEIAQGLQKAAENGKGWDSFRQMVAPYELLMRNAGAEPVQYVGSLLQAAHSLTYGQPMQRAQALANIVIQYGADLYTQDGNDQAGNPTSLLGRAFQAAMSGQTPRQAQQQPQQPQQDVRAIFRQELESIASQAVDRRAAVELQQFEATAPEFWDAPGIQDDVEVLLEAAAKSGRTLTIPDAYAKAIKMNDEINVILEQRKAVEKAKEAAASTQRSRIAASSIRSSPTAAAAAQPAGLRATLEEAAAKLGI